MIKVWLIKRFLIVKNKADIFMKLSLTMLYSLDGIGYADRVSKQDIHHRDHER